MARTPEEMDAAITKILTFLGDTEIRHAADIAKHEADPSSWPILDSGDHSVSQDRHLLREWQNQHADISEGRIAALENKPPSVVEGPAVTTSATAPPKPNAGDVWIVP